jgi:HEPN domain-containing protein
MLEMYLGLFMMDTRDLNGLTGQLFARIAFEDGTDSPIAAGHRTEITRALLSLKRHSESIYISHLMQVKISRLANLFETSQHLTTRTAAEALKQLQEDLLIESASYAFLMIPADKKEMYRQKEPPFGEEVAKAFEDADRDIRAASRCLAFNESTAAVFHLMRASELALQELAGQLGIANAEWKDWGELLTKIDGVLNKLQNDPKTPEREKRLQYFARARNDFAGFNNAWRKHVAHARDHYDEPEAMSVFRHVRGLMQQLASDAPDA